MFPANHAAVDQQTYKLFVDVDICIPASVKIPICDRCGNTYFGPDDSARVVKACRVKLKELLSIKLPDHWEFMPLVDKHSYSDTIDDAPAFRRKDNKASIYYLRNPTKKKKFVIVWPKLGDFNGENETAKTLKKAVYMADIYLEKWLIPTYDKIN